MIRRRWVRICSLPELEPGRGVAALVDDQQVAVFLLPGVPGVPGPPGPPGSSAPGGETAARLRALDNRDPVSGANVLARGLLGSADGVDYVASPMLKHRYDLDSGRCLDGVSPGVRVWPVRVWGNTVEVLSVSGELPGPVDPPGGTATHCPFCALQCSMRLHPGRGHDEPRVEAEPSFPVNQGRMCLKGWASVGLIRHPDRLRQPLVRDTTGRLRAASWDAALDEVAAGIETVRARYGPDAVGVFGSGALTNEKPYLLGKFTRVALRSANIDYNGRYCMSSAAAAQNRAFGLDRGLPFSLSDIARTGALVLWGANPADTMPPLMQWVEEMRTSGGTLVVVDPRRTATAKSADLHIQPVPGSDLAVALGLLHLAAETAVVDSHYVDERTVGWEQVRESAQRWTPREVAAVSGVSEPDLRRLLDALVRPPAAMLITGRGPEQQSKGVDTVTALINLMLALGRVGRPASGYGCLTGQANGQGGREHGQKADQLPGYRSITDAADRAALSAVWEMDPALLPGPGLSAGEMVAGIASPGGIRGLLVFGSDLTVAAPAASRAAEQLRRLDLLAVADVFHSGTAELAHVVLPVTQWAEEDGTVTNLEGRVIRRRRAMDPPDGVRTDLEVLGALAERIGARNGFRFPSAEAVFDELRRASAGGRADYSGITYQRLDVEPGIFWPCPTDGHPGTPRLFADRFHHPDGKARMVAVQWRPPAEPPDREYPLYFTTGRYREHYNSGNQTRRLERLARTSPAPKLQIHPSLARRAGIDEGSHVTVESRRGAARFEVDVTDDIRLDTVFAPFHWSSDGCANLVTIDQTDPISKMPEFKVCSVRLRPEEDRTGSVDQ